MRRADSGNEKFSCERERQGRALWENESPLALDTHGAALDTIILHFLRRTRRVTNARVFLARRLISRTRLYRKRFSRITVYLSQSGVSRAWRGYLNYDDRGKRDRDFSIFQTLFLDFLEISINKISSILTSRILTTKSVLCRYILWVEIRKKNVT